MPSVPRVSVVMPIFNEGLLAGESIESVLSQTFTDFEFIIVDDGSTDGTPEILATCAARDARVRVRRLPRNVSFREALNEGCRLARGEFIARLDGDDVCLPNRLAYQVAYLDAHPEVGVVGSAVQLVDKDGVRGRVKRFPDEPSLVAWSMFFFNSVAHPAVMMRREMLDRVGFYPSECAGGTEDYALFTALSRITRLANLSDVLLLHRTWSEIMTHPSWEAQERDACRIASETATACCGVQIPRDHASLLRGLSRDPVPALGPRAPGTGRPDSKTSRCLLPGQ